MRGKCTLSQPVENQIVPEIINAETSNHCLWGFCMNRNCTKDQDTLIEQSHKVIINNILWKGDQDSLIYTPVTYLEHY